LIDSGSGKPLVHFIIVSYMLNLYAMQHLS